MAAEETLTAIFMLFGVSLMVAVTRVAFMSRKMRSVAAARTAHNYTKGGLKLTRQSDVFTHKTVTRQKIEQPKPSSGSTTVRSSGGGHGTKGKF